VNSRNVDAKRSRLWSVRFLLALALVVLSVTVAACGSKSSSSTTSSGGGSSSDTTTSSPLSVPAGSDIPQTTVKFGVAPFFDGAIYTIAMKEGWFKDVGIDIQPKPAGVQTTPDNAIPKIESGDTDIGVVFGPGKIQNQAHAPDIKLFGFSNSFVGTQILVSPRAYKTSVSELVGQGKPFEEAVKEAFAPMKGKPIGLSNTGQRRVFLTNYFKLAGLTFGDVKPIATDDARILQLAQGGHIDYASPEGAAQQIALLHDGWHVLASIEDLIKGLPAGDERAVGALGHEGLAAKESYVSQHSDTILRVLSVMYRTIDAIKGPDADKYLQDEAPYLTSVTGVKTTQADLKALADNLFDFVPFEKQTEYWVDLSNPFSYTSVYGAQIKAAQGDGVIPKSLDVKPQDAIVGEKFYKQLVALKDAYDKLKPQASGLSGEKATLAEQAATQYGNRNYLDAYRMLRTAVGKG
jgi:ABC-type nitrate/sulfonate/bicarbonate transport system substrate-binding protein